MKLKKDFIVEGLQGF